MKSIIVSICLLNLIHSSTALKCYTCTSIEHELDQRCVTDPDKVENTTPITDCNKNYCISTRVEYLDPKGKVQSMFRGCVDNPTQKNEVIEDDNFRLYYRACQEDLCNGGSGKTGGSGNNKNNYGGFGVLFVPGISHATAFLPSVYLLISSICLFIYHR